jgi:hypothetical protein
MTDVFVRQSRVGNFPSAIELSPEGRTGSGHPSGWPLPLEMRGIAELLAGAPLAKGEVRPRKAPKSLTGGFFNEWLRSSNQRVVCIQLDRLRHMTHCVAFSIRSSDE